MAIFNPDPAAINPPDWTNVTRPVEQPEANKSTALLLDTAGKAVTDVTKIVDTGIKQDIQKQVDTGVDSLRDAYTQSLVALRNTQIASTDKSLLPDTPAENAPVQLQSGLDRIQSLGTALAQNGGKVNDTLYTGALNAQAKQLRAQYPGYRDYIDEQIKSVSGVDPANAFMKNLMEDINRGQENAKVQQNSVLSTLKENADKGFHDTAGVDAASVYSMVQKGIIPPEKGLAWLNSAKKLEYDTKAKADARANRQGDEADDAIQAQKDFSGTITQTLNHNWTTMTIGKGTDTFDAMSKFIQNHAGANDITDERAQAIGQQMQALRTRTAQQLMAEAAQNGTIERLGADGATKVKNQIDARLAPMDLAVQDVFNKDWGSAYSHMNFNKAIGADTGNVMNNAPDEAVRKYIRGSQFIADKGGSEFSKEFQTKMLLGPVPQLEKAWYQGIKTDLLAQPDQAQGKLTSIQGAIQEGQAKGIKSPKTYDEMIKSVNDLANPKMSTELKLNLAKAFFDPTANAGLLSDKNFEMDHYDPILHRQVPGKLSVFTKLTAPEIASSIQELGRTDPNVVTNYRTMLSREFGEQLFSRELKDLSQANQDNTVSSLYKIKFSNDAGSSPHFATVDPATNRELTMTEAKQRGAPVESFNRLNTGMAGLYTAFKGSGSTDPINDVMKVMSVYNTQTTPANGSPPGFNGTMADIPRSIVTSIRESIKAAQKANLPKAEGTQ